MANNHKTNKPRRPHPGVPSKQQILDFISEADESVGKREIAKHFRLKGQDKIALKKVLKDMADEGLIDHSPGRAFHKMGGVPRVTVLRVVSTEDGEVWAEPEQWQGEGAKPRLRVIERGRRSALGVNDRLLARTEERGKGHVAHVMKKLACSAEMLMGVVRKEGSRFFLAPIDKKQRTVFALTDLGEAEVGDLVLAEPVGKGRRNPTAKVDAVLGDPFAPKAFSLIAIHKYGIRNRFPDEVVAEAEKVAKWDLGEREDLTHLPIVAIDPVDARDHDDAIWAEPDDAKDNPGGYKAVVAIADVSYYVRPGSELDREALKRGNSVYFPDRVVPMLPEELSAGICSLKEGVDRAAMVAHIRVDSGGNIKDFRFSRAKVRIAANIAYEDAQAAIDGEKDRVDPGIVKGSLEPLWQCWKVLLQAREAREPLDLDLPERRVQLDEKGRIMSVAPRERLDAHRLVEDYMILANVAAAKALEKKKRPVMYRIHETPGREKLVTLKDYLATFEIPFALGQVVLPKTFNAILEKIGPDHDNRIEITEQILRSQMQARYGPEPLGHFGLALGSYAHFTSPIRRYADLLVHRSLVDAYGLGKGGISAKEAEDFARVGELISALERRAMEAERETVDRYVAAYLADHVGQLVEARITGVQPFGFFATVQDLGGDGLVLAKTLGREYFHYDEKRQALVGEQSRDEYRAGQKLKLKLVEADPASGALRFELPEGSYGGDAGDGPRRRRDGRGRGGGKNRQKGRKRG
ncbi:ribonuclease R [Sphingomicrobium astaxanthinifaciens]|uniref:ribonuclease R n=1 Tax=Sphingomicrobium astaxanthinifaciens TaxID=1227949 RepID=UPI001FCB6296|nr:ribonuclease R [Sphingomicrobium astaxanthinifaciens]MCJ7420674.1 ribonuclease R [Sphingomicrobium astaxanthinifaciens]